MYLPKLFSKLLSLRYISENNIHCTTDGFFASTVSLADILLRCGIESLPGSRGQALACGLFFDDWYLYAVSCGTDHIYGLFKMREQEYDKALGLHADGDDPGVTISFIDMKAERLLQCLEDPAQENRRFLADEIDRVVASRGQRHSKVLRRYFLNPQSKGSYLVAQLYTEYIASLAAADGFVPVSAIYREIYRKKGLRARVPRFLEKNNVGAGRVICDHEKIYVCDPKCPTEAEQLAILAVYAGNISYHSFAAEVWYHARFLTWWAKFPLPILGHSEYDSAIRADMSIGDSELTGPKPYYRLHSRIVKRQIAYHTAEKKQNT